MLSLLLAFIAGGVVVGIIAHRKPQWFNKAVDFVNKVDDKVNTVIKK